MVIWSIWNTNQGLFFPPLFCSLWHVRTCLLFYQTKLCWNTLSLCKSFENVHQGQRSKVLLLMDNCKRRMTWLWLLKCISWVLRYLLWSTLPRWGYGKFVFGLFSPLFFSKAMLQWLPVTQGSDQYWVSRAAEQAAKGLNRECAPWAV